MSKNKNAGKADSKKAIKQLVKKDLESLLVKLNPGMGEKQSSKKIKKASKILVKGIKAKKPVKPLKVSKETPTATAV